MLSFAFFVVGLVVVGGLLFLGASFLLGRGETQPPAELERSPVELPDDRPVDADDVRRLRLSVAVRGYRMTEVDWLIEQLAQALDERDAELAALRPAPLPDSEGSPDPDEVPAGEAPAPGSTAAPAHGSTAAPAPRPHVGGAPSATDADDGRSTLPGATDEELPRA